MKKILFYIHRIQDISVLSPLIHSFGTDENIVHVDFSKILKEKRYHVERLLRKHHINYAEEFNLEQNRDSTGIVITTGAHKNSGLMAKKSKGLKIPSLTLQHGITNELEDGKPITFHADLIALWGPHQKDFFCNREYSLLEKGQGKVPNSPTDRERFIITGAPKFDTLYKPKNVGKGLLNIPESKKAISVFSNTHWATRYSDEANQKFCNTLDSLVKRFRDSFWIFKLHPDEQPDFCQCRFFKYDNCRIVCPTEQEDVVDSQDILRISDAVVMALSTVALEAAILKKPVIPINFTDKSGYRDLKEYRDNIGDVVAHALKNPKKFIRNQEAFIRGFHPAKDNATELLKKIILEILNHGIRYERFQKEKYSF